MPITTGMAIDALAEFVDAKTGDRRHKFDMRARRFLSERSDELDIETRKGRAGSILSLEAATNLYANEAARMAGYRGRFYPVSFGRDLAVDHVSAFYEYRLRRLWYPFRSGKPGDENFEWRAIICEAGKAETVDRSGMIDFETMVLLRHLASYHRALAKSRC